MNEEIAVKREHDIQSVLERVLAQGETYQVFVAHVHSAVSLPFLPPRHHQHTPTQATRQAEREAEVANAPEAMDSAEPTTTTHSDAPQTNTLGYVAVVAKNQHNI